MTVDFGQCVLVVVLAPLNGRVFENTIFPRLDEAVPFALEAIDQIDRSHCRGRVGVCERIVQCNVPDGVGGVAATSGTY